MRFAPIPSVLGELVADLGEEHDFLARLRRFGRLLRFAVDVLIPLMTMNSATATMAKLITTLMKSP